MEKPLRFLGNDNDKDDERNYFSYYLSAIRRFKHSSKVTSRTIP